MSVATPRVRRLELSAIGGVMWRELVAFRRLWTSTTVSSVVEPTIFLLAFGFGYRTLVAEVDGRPYLQYIGTGVVATAVLFSSAFPAMLNTYVKLRFTRAYDSILAAPVDGEELVTAEGLFIACKAGFYCAAPLLVAACFGVDLSVGFLLVPAIGFLTGLGFAFTGIALAGVMPSIDSFSYVMSIVLTPLFLVAGTFFPVENLPSWVATIGLVNPLYHCVELVRNAVFLELSLDDLVHLAVLVVFAASTWRLAIHLLSRRLLG